MAALREAREESGLEVELLGERPPTDEPGTRALIAPRFLDIHRITDTHEHIGMMYWARPKQGSVTLARRGTSRHPLVFVRRVGCPPTRHVQRRKMVLPQSPRGNFGLRAPGRKPLNTPIPQFSVNVFDVSRRTVMKVQKPGFSKIELEKMLFLLNEQLQENGVTGEVCIVGGAAMILAFGSRESTRDIDALVMAPAQCPDGRGTSSRNQRVFPKLAQRWSQRIFLGPIHRDEEILKFSHLRVVAPPAEYILAMKCLAARVGLDEHDKEDTKFLIRHIGLRRPGAVLEIVEKYYPRERIPAKTQYFIQEVCDELFSKTKDIN